MPQTPTPQCTHNLQELLSGLHASVMQLEAHHMGISKDLAVIKRVLQIAALDAQSPLMAEIAQASPGLRRMLEVLASSPNGEMEYAKLLEALDVTPSSVGSTRTRTRLARELIEEVSLGSAARGPWVVRINPQHLQAVRTALSIANT